VAQACSDDRLYLDRAGRIALRGRGDVEPNPCVGCVIVRDGVVLGMGHHKRFGGRHAEREALASCRRKGVDPRGATMYVTLEPCCHVGKQPPCTEAIFRAGIARVVYAREDPNTLSAGGAKMLSSAGVACDLSVASVLARRVSDPFVKHTTEGLPCVIAKWAQTIDGRIGTRTGQSKWISNEWSRSRVHRLRSCVDCIITGLGTVLSDDPMLTARGGGRVRRAATRVVVDTHMNTPMDCALVRSARQTPTIIACSKDSATAHIMGERRLRLDSMGVTIMGVPTRVNERVDLRLLLGSLAQDLGATSVLIEAGGGLLGSLMERDLVDEARVYVAPMLLADDRARGVAGGRCVETLGDARRFTLERLKRLGNDAELTYRRVREDDV